MVVTNGNELLVHFVSDLSVTAAGFMAHYRSIPKSSRTPTAGLERVHGPRVDITPTKPTTQPARSKPKTKPSRPTPKAPSRPPKPVPPRPTPKPRSKPTPKPKPVRPATRSGSRVSPKPKPATRPQPKPTSTTTKPKVKPGVKPTAKPKTNPIAKPGNKTTKAGTNAYLCDRAKLSFPLRVLDYMFMFMILSVSFKPQWVTHCVPYHARE